MRTPNHSIALHKTQFSSSFVLLFFIKSSSKAVSKVAISQHATLSSPQFQLITLLIAALLSTSPWGVFILFHSYWLLPWQQRQRFLPVSCWADWCWGWDPRDVEQSVLEAACWWNPWSPRRSAQDSAPPEKLPKNKRKKQKTKEKEKGKKMCLENFKDYSQ